MGAGGTFSQQLEDTAADAVVVADPQAAAQFYSQASSRGHILASHRCTFSPPPCSVTPPLL
jgi:hypothetical protein